MSASMYLQSWGQLGPILLAANHTRHRANSTQTTRHANAEQKTGEGCGQKKQEHQSPRKGSQWN